MTDRWTGLLAARARVEAADRRIADNVGALKSRLAPDRLAADARRSARAGASAAVSRARDVAGDGARIVADNPVRAALAVTALVALLARHRIADGVSRLTSSRSNTERTSNGR